MKGHIEEDISVIDRDLMRIGGGLGSRVAGSTTVRFGFTQGSFAKPVD